MRAHRDLVRDATGRGRYRRRVSCGLAGETLRQRMRQAIHAGNRRDAKDDAREEHAKPARVAAQIAAGEAKGQSKAASGGSSSCDGRISVDAAGAQADHAVAARRERGVVGHQHERLSRSAWRANIRSMTSRPVVSSRLPVGSSATRIAGSGARARARATRCCSPPESCRRVVAEALAEPDRRELAPWRARRRRRRRRARAGPRRFPAPSWSGSGGTTGTRCRSCGRETAPARPRRARRVLAVDRDARPNRGAPDRPSPSAASICPTPTGRRGRSPRRALY